MSQSTEQAQQMFERAFIDNMRRTNITKFMQDYPTLYGRVIIPTIAKHISMYDLKVEQNKKLEQENERLKAERDEFFGAIESMHNLFQSDRAITKDSIIGHAIQTCYKKYSGDETNK